MRPPHFRQRVMSMAKQRARSWAHAMRRGRGEEADEEASGLSGRAKSSASCGGGSGAAGLGMTRSRRRWWQAKGAEVALVPIGRGKVPTAPGVTEESWYFHAGVELPSGQVVDPKLNAVHPSVEAWRKAIVGDNKVHIMRNGTIE